MGTTFRIYIIFFALFCLSIIAIPRLNISPYPRENIKSFSVVYSCSKSSPEQTEYKATAFLENILSQIKNLKEIKSVSRNNYGKITLSFDGNEDLVSKRFEILSLIRQIRHKLPLGVSYPKIVTNSNSSHSSDPSMVYTLSSRLPIKKIEEVITNTIIPKLILVDGVGNIGTSGILNTEIVANYDKNILLNINSNRNEVIESLRSATSEFSKGNLTEFGLSHIFIKSGKNQLNIESINNSSLINHPFYKIKDVANLGIGDIKPTQYFRINGKNTVLLNIYFLRNRNSIDIANNVRKQVSNLKSILRSDLIPSLGIDGTDYVKQEVKHNLFNIGLSFFLILLISFIYFFNKKKVYFLFVIRILLSIFLSILLLCIFDINLNIYSIQVLYLILPAISLYAVISSHLSLANPSIFFSVLISSSILIITGCFIMYTLVPVNREFIFEILTLLTISTIGSLIVNFMLYFSNKSSNKEINQVIKHDFFEVGILFKNYIRLLHFLTKRKTIIIILIFLVLGAPTFILPKKIAGFNFYNTTIGGKYFQEAISPKLDLFFGGVLRLFISNLSENNSNFSNESETKLYIRAEMPLGTGIEEINALIFKLESYISTLKGIQSYFSHITSGNSAIIEISFNTKNDNTTFPAKIKNLITSKVLNYGGAKWNVYGVGRGFNNLTNQDIPSYSIKLAGYNYDMLENEASILQSNFSKNKRVIKINTNELYDDNDRAESSYKLIVNTQRLSLVRAKEHKIYDVLKNLAEYDDIIDNISIGNKIYRVRLEEKNAYDFTSSALINQPIFIDQNLAFKVSQFGEIKAFQSSGAIHKVNREYIRIISFNYLGDYKIGMNFLNDQLRNYNKIAPVGFSAQVLGFETTDEGTRDYYRFLIILAIVFLALLICTIFFDSIKIPLFLLAILLFNYSGIFYCFYVNDEVNFDQGGLFLIALISMLITIFFILITINIINLNQRLTINKQNTIIVRNLVLQFKLIGLIMLFFLIPQIRFLFEIPGFFWKSFFTGLNASIGIVVISFVLILPIFFIKSNRLLYDKK